MGEWAMSEPTQQEIDDFRNEVAMINEQLEKSREPVERMSRACNLSLAAIQNSIFPDGVILWVILNRMAQQERLAPLAYSRA